MDIEALPAPVLHAKEMMQASGKWTTNRIQREQISKFKVMTLKYGKKTFQNELIAPEQLLSGIPSIPIESGSGNESLLSPASGYQFRFDFDIGYLRKSPCRICANQPELPNCAESCQVLDKLHSVLSRSITCYR